MAAMTTVKEEPEDHEWDLLVSLCSRGDEPPSDLTRRAYMALPCGVGTHGQVASHEVFWCVKELARAVILDIGPQIGRRYYMGESGTQPLATVGSMVRRGEGEGGVQVWGWQHPDQ